MAQKPHFVRTKILTGLGIFIIIAGLTFSFLKPKTFLVEVASIQNDTFIQTIKEDGITRSKDRYQITSPYTGTLSRVEVKVGDQVKKGQKIAHVSWDYESSITSPAEGVISKIIRESAGAINRGELILEVSNPKNLEIIVDLLTKEATHVKEGLPVEIKNWGGNESLEGKVKRIEPTAFTKVSSLGVEEQRVNVVIEITSPKNKWESLGDYFRIEAHILINKLEDQPLIPLSALFRYQDQWAAYTIENQKAKLKPIQISHRNQTHAIMTSGLNPGDSVILYPGDSIQNGVPVKLEK